MYEKASVELQVSRLLDLLKPQILQDKSNWIFKITAWVIL